jgi:hypothetical protein
VVFNPDFGGDNFWEKLRRQTQDANPNVIQLAAELMWLIFLFPLGKRVGDVGPSPKASSKLNKVKEVLSWANLPSPNGKVVNFDALWNWQVRQDLQTLLPRHSIHAASIDSI